MAWLNAIASWIDETRNKDKRAVLACSALKRRYRDILIGDRSDVRLVYLKGDEALVGRRLSTRHEHFMPASLLRSQFEALEEPRADENAIVVSVEPSPKVIADRILAALGLATAAKSE